MPVLLVGVFVAFDPEEEEVNLTFIARGCALQEIIFHTALEVFPPNATRL